MKRKDYYIGILIGLLIGLFSLPTLNNFGFGSGSLTKIFWVLILAVVVPGCLFFGNFLSRWLPTVQFFKYAAVGALNVAIDLGVLNVLISISGINRGIGYSVFKTVSFFVVLGHSYLWNRYWAFRGLGASNIAREFITFSIISAIGLALNVGVASLVVNLVGPLNNASGNLWANVGALSAVIISILWNFFTYKFIVFRPHSN